MGPLIMTLLVRDEQDIVGENIAFHLAQGVDHVIVTDHLSRDGTPDILEDFARQGVATILREKDPALRQSIWVTRMARMAHARFGAAWVINNDSDEFWVAMRSTNLRDAFVEAGDAKLVTAPRHNFACVVPARGPFWQTMIYRTAVSLNAHGRPLPPKIAHAGSRDVTVETGNHAVKDVEPGPVADGLVEILHFPIRSDMQYKQKIANGMDAVRRNADLPARTCSTWREEVRYLEAIGRSPFLDALEFDEARITEGLSNGTLVRDTRLRDHFALAGQI